MCVTAGLYAACFPPHAHAALLFVALVPLLLAVDGVGPRDAALLGGGFGLLGAAAVSAWVAPTLVGFFEKPWSLTGPLLAIFWFGMAAPYYAIAFAALATARPLLPRAAWLLLVPAAWVCAELLRASFGLRAAWALVGDGFVEWPRLRQLAELTGVYGIGALVALANTLLAEALRLAALRARGRPAPLAPAACSAAALALASCAALGFGELRLRELASAPRGEALEVVLVQGNVPQELRWRRAAASRVLRRYADLTRDALADGGRADLVLWPENALQSAVDDPVYGAALRRSIERGGVPTLLGAPRSGVLGAARRHWNSVHVLSPGAEPVHYDKRRLLPFSETDPLGGWLPRSRRGDLDLGGFTPGTRPGLLRVAGNSLGVMICFEAIYPELARELAGSGARLLVNPSNDGWFRGAGSAEQHLRQTIFRAIETRLPLLRVTTTGVSAVVLPDGRVDRRLGSGEQGVLRARIRLSADPPTFYVRFGDVFALALSGALACCAAVALWRRSQTPRALMRPRACSAADEVNV